ncbi:hypothetical protein AM1BK_29300 [Neobacillus kokaensis]|uniref:Uncharacterized protein n=1 Tax=Neobacillus kokaensis TaxID=2759023 RepID=A0ABQ3N7C5_9BACI|nr:hypothetical protein AM1BK_29300 [Neobacillus kokaensis]
MGIWKEKMWNKQKWYKSQKKLFGNYYTPILSLSIKKMSSVLLGEGHQGSDLPYLTKVSSKIELLSNSLGVHLLGACPHRINIL